MSGGLNNPARQEVLKQFVIDYKPDIICIQETKLANITPATIRAALGQDYENSFCFLPAIGTREGSC
jgi:exonuclease III